ncbi:MAG: hypothetical protein NT159_05580 [Proteobacteria bacterium]|nr:hypothetical protein [Pseudomonadota bacterium]
MSQRSWSSVSRRLLLICATGVACSALAQADPATALREKYASLEGQLRQNQFKQPLVLASIEAPNGLQGDIYAIVAYPFEAVSAGLNNPDHWCDVMMLHINTKYCHAATGSSATILSVNIGKKTYEELVDTARVEFDYRVVAATAEYFGILLSAKEGPLGTSDYRIRLEAVALPDAKTFLHLTYAYTIKFTGRLAMQAYLGTIGSHKIGFSVIGTLADGQPDYVGGVRGLVERNTMRYYLGIDTLLGTAHAATAIQNEQRLQTWFTAVEQYPRQLHEMNREKYLEMKRAEYVRQQTDGEKRSP